MGMAVAYDPKVMLATMCILGAILAAACTFGSGGTASTSGQKKLSALGG